MNTVTLAEEFLAYCKAHPGMRFWQALLSWSELPFIAVCPKPPGDYGLQDTFFWKGKGP